MKKKRKQNRSKSNRNRYYFELNNQPYGYSGLVPVENGDFQNWVDSGKRNMEERGYETDLETTEKFLAELSVHTCSMDELTSHSHFITGRLNGGYKGMDGWNHYPFNGFSENPQTGESKELSDEKMDEIFLCKLFHPTVCYLWSLLNEEPEPQDKMCWEGNGVSSSFKGNVDHLIKIHFNEEEQPPKSFIIGATKYRTSNAGSVVPYPMKSRELNQNTISRLSW
jgi:hypothetical protein